MQKTTCNRTGLKTKPDLFQAFFLILLFGIWVGRQTASAQDCPLTCHNINLSLDTAQGGVSTILPEHLLSGETSCPDGVFKVTIYAPNGNLIGNTVNCNWVGYSLIGKVTDSITGNSCWAKINVEDKAGPNLNCVKDTIHCLELNTYSSGLDRFPFGLAIDNCGIKSQVSISMVCTEYPCSNIEFVGLCVRTVIATDTWGLASSCQDSFWLSRDSLDNLTGPRDTVLDCSIADTIAKDANGNPHPSRVGIPTISGIPVWPNNSVCKILSKYTDVVYSLCGPKSRKIRREWTIVDWCAGEDTALIQWIKILDTSNPVLVDRGEISASVGTHNCKAPIDLTMPGASDCSGIKEVFFSAVVLPDGHGGLGAVYNGYINGGSQRIYLPSGRHEVHLFISDHCGNTAFDTLIVNVTDHIPPTPVCDEHTATTLDPENCWARIYASDLDNGSRDNCCGTLYFSIAHMDSVTVHTEILRDKIKAKFGESKYNSKSGFFEEVIDRWINCHVFNDYIDLGYCGDNQLVMRVYEACLIPKYDPHVHADSRHSFYCKAAYGHQGVYNTDQENVDGLIDDLMQNTPVQYINTHFTLGYRNYSDCMVWVNVADKVAPTCDVDAEKYAFCDGVPYLMVAHNNYNKELLGCYGANGYYDTAYLQLDKYDTGGKINAYDLFDNPVFEDNCGSVKVDTFTSGSLNNCGAGILTRTWTGTDECGLLTTTCAQKLKILHRSDFEVVFPKDIETTCVDNPSQFNNPTGENFPKIFDDECEHVGISFSDQRYDIVSDACYKIVRTWKVIDWCAYDPDQHYRSKDYIADTAVEFRAAPDKYSERFCQFRYLKDNGDGYILYTQIIKVKNTVAPTITRVDSTITCAGSTETCLGHIKLSMSTTDDCTPGAEMRWVIYIDRGNNGTIDQTSYHYGERVSVDADFPVGKHKITFLTEDICGNETRRESVVDVELCKLPTPYLLDGLAVDLMPIDANQDGNPESGMVRIWASDFDAGSSAGCGQHIVAFSFSSDTSDKSRTYTCDSIGKRYVNIWVTDSYGNQDFSTTYILIQNNANGCAPGTQAITGSITGRIKTEDQLDVEKVSVQLQGANALPAVTKADGLYAFNSMKMGGSYKVMPKKDINPLNGVSTLDLLLIQKHILGLQPLNSPYKLIAADINKSNDVSSVDLVELRKLILGIYDKFPGNESWRFIPKSHVFRNAANPFETGFPEYQDISSFNQNSFADFVGVKVGDINATVVANQLLGNESRAPGKEFVLRTDDLGFADQDQIKVPVFASDLHLIQGYQFTLNFNPKALKLSQVIPGVAGMSQVNFGLQRADDGRITTSWTTTRAIESRDQPLFTLVFIALQKGRLHDQLYINSSMTRAEAYDRQQDILNVRLQVGAKENKGQFVLLQNTPNPFLQSTRIGYQMPESGQGVLKIFDLNGRLVKQVGLDYQKGYNEARISRDELKASGVMYYQLQAGGYTATKKMVVIE